MHLLSISHVTKRFGAFTALDDVSLEVEAGQTLALLGENGAGKSTLMRIVYGMAQPDAGGIRWDGRAVSLPHPAAARGLGIGMVHQHFTLAPGMTVAENLALAAPPKGWLSPSRMVSAAERLSRETGLEVDARATAGGLPLGMQQRVEILKALSASACLLILDEPTGVLAPGEVEGLFDTLRRLRNNGTALILITHKLPEALAFADAVAVLRRGRLVLSAPRADVDADALANAMVGRSLVPTVVTPFKESGEVLVETPLLASPGNEGIIRAGETLGVAGVEGNGQAELVETLVGLRSGRVRLRDRNGLAEAGHWSIERRIAWGLAHIPEDRHATALALHLSVRDNLFLSGDALPRHGVWTDRPAARGIAAALMEEYDVRAQSQDMPMAALSGGNQQKAVVARELSRKPQLLLAVHPTRGLDVAASEFVHNAIGGHRERGGATLLVSSELDELLALSDRIVVMYAGRVAGEMRPGGANDHATLGRMMTGAAS